MLPPKSDANIWDVWLKSGLLAMFLIRLFVAILGFWLLRLADPLSCCNGKYISPPAKYTLIEQSENVSELQDNTNTALTFIARKQVVMYALITNLALLNLIIVLCSDKNRNMTNDLILFLIILSVAIFVPLVALIIFRRTLNSQRTTPCTIWTSMKEYMMFWKST